MPSWCIPASCAKALRPVIALLACTVEPVKSLSSWLPRRLQTVNWRPPGPDRYDNEPKSLPGPAHVAGYFESARRTLPACCIRPCLEYSESSPQLPPPPLKPDGEIYGRCGSRPREKTPRPRTRTSRVEPNHEPARDTAAEKSLACIEDEC